MSVTHHMRRISFLAATAVTTIIGFGVPHPVHAAATIVVDTVTDEDLQNADCSLREAIVAANTNASYNGCTATGAGANDMIVFDIDPPTIAIGSTSLPAITESVTIDGGEGRVELHGPGGPRVPGKHGLIVNSGGSGTTIRNLVVNNFADDGIYIDADDVSILGCFIGTDAAGTAEAPNQGFGVHVFRGSGARIGGASSGAPCAGDCNLISGAISFNANVFLDDNATGAVVSGNFIGTDVMGTAAIPNNALEGVRNRGDGNRIGGTDGTSPGGSCTGECNLISGNATRGIRVDEPASDTAILGNFIGTDVTGTEAVGNSLGIETYPTLLIGGTTAATRNIISGNDFTGVLVRGTAPVLQGNYLGTTSDGTAAIPGTSTAIIVFQAVGATIGGTMPGAGNLVSGVDTGVRIDHSTNTQVVGNRFGTAADGSTPLPNAAAVLIHEAASNNFVGGVAAGAGNIIAFSEVDGVLLDGTTPPVHGNAIRGNSIYSSGARGIHLRNNPNDNLAPPTILGIGPLHGTSCAPCAVDIYSDADDEGRVFEGSVFTNDGNWTFNGPVSGPHVTATNTDMTNNTSEFSAPFSLASPTPTDSPTSSSTASPTRTPTSTRTASTIATGTPSQTATGAPTGTRTATSSATPSAAPSPTATPTVPTGATPTATPPSLCVGDCDGGSTVTIGELITLVNIILGIAQPAACVHGIPDGATVNIALIIQAVNNSLSGCG
jgi:CSLREA domain-containing protein